jgi:hypothetical protein
MEKTNMSSKKGRENHNQGNGFIEEFKSFLSFLQNLWGMLAGVSVLFPLSNALAKVIPLEPWPEGGFMFFAPQLVTTVTTICSLFIITITFGQRHKSRSQEKKYSVQWQAPISFGIGSISMVIYLITYFAARNNFFYGALGWESDDLRWAIGDIVLLFSYSALFTFFTRAFVLLGMTEYFRKER